MRFTKLTHSCVRLEKDGAVLVIDPGMFGDAAADLADATAVLVTHEHPDHLDGDAIRAALDADPALTLWAPRAVAEQFGDRARQVGPGDAPQIAGFSVHAHGEQHAVIHPDIPVVANTGFLIDGEVFHPGDAFTIPDEPVRTLLVPVSAPWLKAAEWIDYFREVAPARGFAIHDDILNHNGLALVTRLMSVTGGQLTRLEPGTTVDL